MQPDPGLILVCPGSFPNGSGAAATHGVGGGAARGLGADSVRTPV